MKFILTTIVLVFSFSSSYAIFYDASSGDVTLLGIYKVQLSEQVQNTLHRASEAKDWLVNKSILAEARKAYNVYTETKQLTGTIAATIKDVKALTEKARNDATNISIINAEQLQNLKNYLSWRDELSGRGYSSLLGLNEYYERETSTFRDRNGELNIAQSLLSSGDDAEYARKRITFRRLNVQVKRYRRLNQDKRFRELMEEVRVMEREASYLQVKINLALFGKELRDYKGSLQSLTSAFDKHQADIKNGQNKTPSKTDLEIGENMERLYNVLEKADQKRQEAMTILYETTREINPYSIDFVYRNQALIRKGKSRGLTNSSTIDDGYSVTAPRAINKKDFYGN